MDEIIIRKPDDFHVHLRDWVLLCKVLFFTSYIFRRCVVMGNLSKPIVTAEDVLRYRKEIMANAGHDDFEPIMTVMLVNRTTPQIVREAYEAGARVLKLIPGGTSTNSEEGVNLVNLEQYYSVFETVQDLGMMFSGHWELAFDPETGKNIPELKREERAIPYLLELITNFPELKMVVEHVSTRVMIGLVKESPKNVAATITAHHPILTYWDVCNKKGEIINPFNYCKPIAKLENDRRAVEETMISGNPKFFLGPDSAPHWIDKKRKPPYAAGIFSAPVVLPILAQIFERNRIIDNLENFTSRFGAEFYGIPLGEKTIKLRRIRWTIPYDYESVPIFMGGKTLDWQVSL